MSGEAEKVISYAARVTGFIDREHLTAVEKAWVVQETLAGFSENYNPGVLGCRKAVSTDYASIEWTESGTGFSDLYGRRFIDCLGGYGIFNIGHRHPEVIKAVKHQLDRQALPSQELLDPLRAMLARLVAMITPGELQYSFFCNSGTEAVAGALRLARTYTGRPGIIAAVGAFQADFPASCSATTKALNLKPRLPLLNEVQHVPYGDAYALETIISSSFAVGNQIAAVILEPIQGEGGVNLPPDDYFPAVRQICDRFGVLLISDEVQTGFGRTGKLFGIEHYEVVPDILCLGKAFGGGVMPIGAYVSTAEILQQMNPGLYVHTSAFGGNSLACAAAIATIKVIFEEKLVEQAAAKGAYLLPRLKDLSKKYPVLKALRGKGLLIGLEFVDERAGHEVARGLFDHNILVDGTLTSTAAIRIEPPLTIEYAELDYVLEVLEKVLGQISIRL